MIAERIDPEVVIALLLEGLPDGADLFDSHAAHEMLHVARISPGCLCCTGNLTMRVTLNRLLRQRPTRLYISLATSTHLAQIRQLLSEAPYDEWLSVIDVLATM